MTAPLSRRAFLAAPALATARAGRLRLVDSKGEKVTFFAGERPLFEYRYSNARPKTYIHPLYSPGGVPITIDGPKDHIHHRGVMLAWSDVKGYDFWGEDNPGPPHGTIVHEKFESVRENPPEVTGLNHWTGNGELIVVERRTVRAPAQSAGTVLVEWESELRTARDAVVLSAEQHPYDGLGIRFIRSMDGGKVLNAGGTDTIDKANGEPAAWAAYAGALESGGVCGAAIFDHPRNPRHPSPFFVMNKPFGYLSAAPTFREPLRIEPGQPLRFRWAILTFMGTPERARLDRAYKDWANPRRG